VFEAGKRVFAANTEEALALKVFGAPTYVYRSELFWGQDRLDFLERALAQA
jgi:2-hydroxychromene-2-carboxylate isomerase